MNRSHATDGREGGAMGESTQIHELLIEQDERGWERWEVGLPQRAEALVEEWRRTRVPPRIRLRSQLLEAIFPSSSGARPVEGVVLTGSAVRRKQERLRSMEALITHFWREPAFALFTGEGTSVRALQLFLEGLIGLHPWRGQGAEAFEVYRVEGGVYFRVYVPRADLPEFLRGAGVRDVMELRVHLGAGVVALPTELVCRYILPALLEAEVQAAERGFPWVADARDLSRWRIGLA